VKSCSATKATSEEASSAQLNAEPGTPLTPKRPSSKRTISSASASNRRAASSRAFSTSATQAPRIALPPSCSERDPKVPRPVLTSAVSDSTTRTSSIGTPSKAAASWA